MAEGRYLLLVVLSFFLLFGCCSYFTATGNETGQSNGASGPSTAKVVNSAPIVNLTLKESQGTSPFNLSYLYLCYDPDNNLISCELKIDGKVFAKGSSQGALFPFNYTYPDFYWNATEEPGNHTLEIIATDSKGLNASKEVIFTVFTGWLTEPGWYQCNNKSIEPCTTFQQGYCDKFTPTDISVREAASEAIAKHPGAFSLNQLLDIYDWVHSNVFYQNVPIDLWPPYYPNETLQTKSGDCKNQAVLIASMVEAIGGSARVLYIPGCRHAFAEVYLGNDSDVDALNNAIGAHYQLTKEEYSQIHWHYSTNEDNQTENWFIFDTAGGTFPGQSISDCFNASQTFELRDCSDPGLNAPEVQGTEYGPFVRVNDTQVIQPRWGYHYGITPNNIPSVYRWCHYKVSVESRSRPTLDWYVTDENGYNNFANHDSFSYYYGEEQVQKGVYEFDWTKSKMFYVILVNGNDDYAMTAKTEVTEICYK